MKQLLYIFILALIMSCNLIKPKNPEFYCKINGKVFTPGGCDPCIPVRISWNEKDGVLFISANKKNSNLSLIISFPNKSIQKGKYILVNDFSSSNAVYVPDELNDNLKYVSLNGGFIEITRQDGFLISGSFEFEVQHNKTTFSITKGEFNNISYYQNIIR
jgi:Family of unknown function (DUF6252)